MRFSMVATMMRCRACRNFRRLRAISREAALCLAIFCLYVPNIRWIRPMTALLVVPSSVAISLARRLPHIARNLRSRRGVQNEPINTLALNPEGGQLRDLHSSTRFLVPNCSSRKLRAITLSISAKAQNAFSYPGVDFRGSFASRLLRSSIGFRRRSAPSSSSRASATRKAQLFCPRPCRSRSNMAEASGCDHSGRVSQSTNPNQDRQSGSALRTRSRAIPARTARAALPFRQINRVWIGHVLTTAAC
jgi:hypothetical protein